MGIRYLRVKFWGNDTETKPYRRWLFQGTRERDDNRTLNGNDEMNEEKSLFSQGKQKRGPGLKSAPRGWFQYPKLRPY